MSATAHLRQVKVIGPIWPTAKRPTIEWADHISVVKTSRRIGFAQTDCMSPVRGAVASVMNVFESFEERPKFTYRLEVGRVRTGRGPEIGPAGTEGKFRRADGSKKDGFNRDGSDLAQAA